MIVNPFLKQVFAYQRAKDESYDESRLYGKWSWGVGGHIEEGEGDNPIHSSLLRELEEEIYIEGSANPKVLGYVNSNTDDVSKVHFGVLYVVETDAIAVRPKDPEIANGELRPINELENICLSDAEVEALSAITLQPLKQYLK